jgi:hypothetical protein
MHEKEPKCSGSCDYRKLVKQEDRFTILTYFGTTSLFLRQSPEVHFLPAPVCQVPVTMLSRDPGRTVHTDRNNHAIYMSLAKRLHSQ